MPRFGLQGKANNDLTQRPKPTLLTAATTQQLPYITIIGYF